MSLSKFRIFLQLIFSWPANTSSILQIFNLMDKYSNQKIVVLGGYGTFGSLISEQLVNLANVVIAGRDRERGQKFADSIKANYVLCNAKDKGSLQNAVSGAYLVINTSGPFLPKHDSITQTCIEQNCHYIDLADDRDYVKDFKQLHELSRERKVFACTGASTTPAVTHALVPALISRFRNTHSIKIYLSAGNKNKPGVSTFKSILYIRARQSRCGATAGGKSCGAGVYPKFLIFLSPSANA